MTMLLGTLSVLTRMASSANSPPSLPCTATGRDLRRRDFFCQAPGSKLRLRMEISFSPLLSADLQRDVRAATHFTRWLERTSAGFDLRRVHVRDAVRFGARVGFIFVEAEALHEGRPVPRYAMLRGDSASILPVLRRPGLPPLAVLTCEPRLPMGEPALLSLPAGMIDGEDFTTAALRELGEEIGADLSVKPGDLIALGRCWTTPGGCDEEIALFATEIDAPPGLAESLAGRRTGNPAEHESIAVAVIELDAIPGLPKTDAKTLLSYHLYRARRPIALRS
jgi:ADP-sugar diphosphatase